MARRLFAPCNAALRPALCFRFLSERAAGGGILPYPDGHFTRGGVGRLPLRADGRPAWGLLPIANDFRICLDVTIIPHMRARLGCVFGFAAALFPHITRAIEDYTGAMALLQSSTSFGPDEEHLLPSPCAAPKAAGGGREKRDAV